MQSPLKARERILVMGSFNSGKSTCWVKWAEWMAKSENETVYVGDTDFAAERMLGGDYNGEEKIGGVTWDSYGNVKVMQLVTWEDYIKFSDFCAKHPTPNDLVVVDMVHQAWEEVKQDFVQKVYGKELDEMFLESKIKSVRAGKDGGNPLSDAHGQTWDVINKRYNRFMAGCVYRTRAHVLCCTPADKIDRDRDKGDIINQYGRYSVKPRGQKNLGHSFHTILLVSDEKEGHVITTVKERDVKPPEPQREKFAGQVYEDFVMDYLVMNCGWKVK